MKFSPEYIAFVTNSKLIQALWRKRGVRVGDIFIFSKQWNDPCLYLVVGVHPPTKRARQWYVDYIYLSDLGLDRDGVITHWGETVRVLRWLPTLDDLVEGLEKRVGGASLLFRSAELGWRGQVWSHDYLCSCIDCGKERLASTVASKEPIIVLAHLMERVLEEEGDD